MKYASLSKQILETYENMQQILRSMTLKFFVIQRLSSYVRCLLLYRTVIMKTVGCYLLYYYSYIIRTTHIAACLLLDFLPKSLSLFFLRERKERQHMGTSENFFNVFLLVFYFSCSLE